MANLSVGKAWEEASAFLAKESRLVAPVALALLMIPSAVQGWANPSVPGQPGAVPLLGLVTLVVGFAGQLAIARLAIGWSGSVGGVIGEAFRRIPVAIAAALMIYLPLLFALVVALGILIGGEDLARLETLTPEQLVQLPGVAWTLFLFAVAMIALGAKFLPSTAVVMSEKVGPLSLIRRSWALTSGHFWRLLALVFLLIIAVLILTGATGLVVGTLAVLVAGPIEPFSLSALLVALATGLVTALLGSVYAAMIGRIYVQLVRQPSVPEVHRE